jgi:hypothetical protein
MQKTDTANRLGVLPSDKGTDPRLEGMYDTTVAIDPFTKAGKNNFETTQVSGTCTIEIRGSRIPVSCENIRLEIQDKTGRRLFETTTMNGAFTFTFRQPVSHYRVIVKSKNLKIKGDGFYRLGEVPRIILTTR